MRSSKLPLEGVDVQIHGIIPIFKGHLASIEVEGYKTVSIDVFDNVICFMFHQNKDESHLL